VPFRERSTRSNERVTKSLRFNPMRDFSQELLVIAKELRSKDLNMDYDAKMSETTKKLRDLAKQLVKHQNRQRTKPMDRSFVEALEILNHNLNEAMRELG